MGLSSCYSIPSTTAPIVDEDKATMQIPCGNLQLPLEVPEKNLLGIFSPEPKTAAPNLDHEVRRALDDPLGCLPLANIVHPGEQVVILVDDHTRSTPTARILPIVVDLLLQAGITSEKMHIIVARGTHRALTEKELSAKLGPTFLKRFRVTQHDCHAADQMAFVGITHNGTPVWVNHLVFEADRRIGIGHIGPSPFTGYSGTNKLIIPGVASIDTVNFNHSFVPAVFRQIGRIGETVDLITRHDIDEAAAMVGMDMVLNVVLNQNEEVIQAFAGKPMEVFRPGLKLARQVHEVILPILADIAVTSGNPYSIDLYQATRAIEYADSAVREGGAIILLADCPDGVGDREFYDLMVNAWQPENFLRAISRRTMKVNNAALGYCLSRIMAEKRIYVKSDHISAQEMKAMRLLQCENLQRTVDHLLDEYGPATQVAVFPTGSVTIPRITDRDQEMEDRA